MAKKAKKKTGRKKDIDLSETETKKVVRGDDLEGLRDKVEEYLDLAKRTKADFLNYQERAIREQKQIRKYAVEEFIRDFIPALDAVRESVKSAEETTDVKRLVEGVRLIEKEFLRVLSKNGITPIEALGKVFDPAFHEAASVVEREDAEENTVLVEIRRGWMLRDRVLRPSLVQIARPAEKTDNVPEEKSEEEAEGPGEKE